MSTYVGWGLLDTAGQVGLRSAPFELIDFDSDYSTGLMTRPDTSTSATRAFELLDRIAAAGSQGLTLAKLAEDVPTAKSTTHRYVATLLQLGALRRDGAGRLRLGLKLIELASAMLSADDLCLASEPVMHDLVARTGETVHLGVPDNGQVVYVAKAESPQSVRLVSHVGARVPLHCTAMGKALLARLDGSALHDALQRPRVTRTVHTIIAADGLAVELEQIRRRGVAIDDEENELGVRCVGAAIVGRRGDSLGAISVSAPASRMTSERCAQIAPTVMAAADAIAVQLGRPAANQTRTR